MGKTPILERRFLAKDKDIITEGEETDHHAYIIQSGSVVVLNEKNGEQVELARLYPGDIFGETALMFDEPRTATVRALQDCNLIVITRQLMDEKLRDSDATVRAIVRMMKERLKASNADRVAKTPTGVSEVQRLFSDAFKLVIKHLDPDKRKAYQQEASPILREFLDLTQSYIDGRR